MYKKEFLSISLFLVLFTGILAEEKVSTELTKIENFYNTKNNPDPKPELMLRENLSNALKQAIRRHLKDGKEKAATVRPESIKYEQIEDSNLVVTVFEDYVFEFRFGANPRKYHIAPVSHRFFKKDKDWQKNGANFNATVEKKGDN